MATPGPVRRSLATLKQVGLTIVCVCGVSGIAWADMVLSVTADFSQLVIVDGTFNGAPVSFYSGIQSASLDGGKTVFDAYCVDIYHDNYVPVSYNVSLMSIAGLSSPPLTSGATGGNGNAVGYLYDTDAAGASGDRIKAAALQVAIWTVEYGGAFKDTDSVVGTSNQSKVAAQAAAYLADYNANFNPSTTYNATWFHADPHVRNLYQDLVGPGGSVPADALPAPEPSSFVMAASAVLMFGGYAWRRRRLAAKTALS